MGYKSSIRKFSTLSNALINNSIKIAKAQDKTNKDNLFNINTPLPERGLMLKQSLATLKPKIYWGYVFTINILVTMSAFYFFKDTNTAFTTFIIFIILSLFHYLIKIMIDIMNNNRLIQYKNKLYMLNEFLKPYLDILQTRRQVLIKVDAYQNILTDNWDKEKSHFIKYTIRKNHLFDYIYASEINHAIELLLIGRKIRP